jgi:hypothetical protein
MTDSVEDLREPPPIRGAFLDVAVHLQFSRPDGQAILLAPVRYMDLRGRLHTAWPGLITDGRSGPGKLLLGTPFCPEHLRSAIIHDWYCAKAKLIQPGRERDSLRRSADVLFGECLRQSGVGRVVAAVMVTAVMTHARIVRRRPAVDWRVDFISEAASHAGACEGLLAT